MMHRRLLFACSVASLLTFSACSGGSQSPDPTTPSLVSSRDVALVQDVSKRGDEFSISSTTFADNARVPQSMVFNGTLGTVCKGGNKSPALFWSKPPFGTVSFAAVMFDETANFSHWGIYNMRSDANRLPQGVSTAPTSFWTQVVNDAGNLGYTGPCPPPGLVHHYVITLYALDRRLELNSSPMFPATVETLLRAMIGNVIGRTSITGLYST